MKLVEYIKDTRGELKHVTWPTKRQTLNYSLIVIGISLVTAAVLALADHIFSLGLEALILGN
ncbi:MAG: preprotein translocase subunit SecE [bacterium]|nr:preprotein translocase subunit SecE [bacterium]